MTGLEDIKLAAQDRFVVISGCSGGGKSTLIEALAGRGWPVVTEPGRRIVRDQLAGDGAALPWVDPEAFARKAIAMALSDLERAARETSRWVFFDRSLVDATAALEHVTGFPAPPAAIGRGRYRRGVFLLPPWPELYATDPERRHDFASAVAEYERLERAYPQAGYEVTRVPKTSVSQRAEFILAALAQPG